MKLIISCSRHRSAWQTAALALLLLIALTLSALYPLVQTHAQDCYDCNGGGGDQPPEPPEPGGDPGGGPGDDPCDDPDDPSDPPDRPDPPGCVTFFDPPTIGANLVLDPAYPITLGQDPDDRGVDVRGIAAIGGLRHCPDSGSAQITSFSVVKIELAQSSVAWINGALARKYPGAHVKGGYPFTPPFSVSGIGSGQAQLSFHLAPLDPGYYEVTVVATQQDGQSASVALRVPVYLMESSLIQ